MANEPNPFLQTREYEGTPGTIYDYPTPNSEAARLGVESALSDNPTTKLYDLNSAGEIPAISLLLNPAARMKYAVQKLAGAPTRTEDGEHYDKKTAENLMEKSGIKIDVPESGISKREFDVKTERKREKAIIDFQISRLDGGGSSLFLGQLAGSMVDPINLASSFIPAGELFGLANGVGKMGVAKVLSRAATGAVEGTIGAAAIEPANFALSKSLEDDYNISNSFLNILTGAAMGAALHPMIGAVRDAFIKAPIETKTALIKETLRQTISDENINPEFSRRATGFDRMVQEEAFPTDLDYGAKISPDFRDQRVKLIADVGSTLENGSQVKLKIGNKEYLVVDRYAADNGKIRFLLDDGREVKPGKIIAEAERIGKPLEVSRVSPEAPITPDGLGEQASLPNLGVGNEAKQQKGFRQGLVHEIRVLTENGITASVKLGDKTLDIVGVSPEGKFISVSGEEFVPGKLLQESQGKGVPLTVEAKGKISGIDFRSTLSPEEHIENLKSLYKDSNKKANGSLPGDEERKTAIDERAKELETHKLPEFEENKNYSEDAGLKAIEEDANESEQMLKDIDPEKTDERIKNYNDAIDFEKEKARFKENFVNCQFKSGGG